MGRISKGILGPVSGTVGTVVGATWKTIAYLRSQPNKSKRTSTVNVFGKCSVYFVNAFT